MNGAWSAFVAAMTAWHRAKLLIESSVAVSHDALHVIIGVLAWLTIALLLRRPVSSWHAWLWLLALIGWNETVDLWIEQWPKPGMQYREGARDVILTMLLPTVLLFAARIRPAAFRPVPRRRNGFKRS